MIHFNYPPPDRSSKYNTNAKLVSFVFFAIEFTKLIEFVFLKKSEAWYQILLKTNILCNHNTSKLLVPNLK